MLLLTVLARQGDTSPDLIAAAGLAGLRRPMLPSSIAPEDRELVFKMGRALMTAADRHAVEARPMFEEIVSAYPKTPNLHYTYGAFLLTNEPDLAVGEFQKELEIQPRHLPTLVSLAMEYLKRGEPAKARPVAELAARIAPVNFTARAALGRTLLDLDETEKGMRELEVAVKLAPESPQVHLSLASAYAKLGRKAEAARERSEFARLKKQVDAEQGR